MWNRTQACEPGRHFLLLLLLLEVVNSLPQQRDPLERKEREGGRGEESLDGEFLQCLDHPSRRRTDGGREGETALYITWPATNSAGRSVARSVGGRASLPPFLYKFATAHATQNTRRRRQQQGIGHQ